MLHVSRSILLEASPAKVWSVIGGFQALPDWHPAVADSAKEIIDGVEHRRLSLNGGGEILEKSLGADRTSYAYEIVESPLPVAGYRSTLTLVDCGRTCAVIWTSTFAATGDGAAEVVAGIYEAGFGALSQRFDG